MLAQCNAVKCGRGKEVAAAQKIQTSRVKSEQRSGSVKPAGHGGGEDAGQATQEWTADVYRPRWRFAFYSRHNKPDTIFLSYTKSLHILSTAHSSAVCP